MVNDIIHQEQQLKPEPGLIGQQQEVHVYRGGRWCIRDGTRFGKPPYYGDLTTGYLRAADLGGTRHQGARPLSGGALVKPEDGH